MNLNLTLFIQFIVFFILVFFVKKFIYPPLNKILKKRIKNIENNIFLVNKNIIKNENIKIKIKKKLLEIKNKKNKILIKAKKKSKIIIENAKKNASFEVLNILNNAKFKIKNDIFLARNDLKNEIIFLTMESLQKILKKEINYDQHINCLNKLSINL